MESKLYTKAQIKDAIWQELKESGYTGENNDRAYEIIGVVMAGMEKIALANTPTGPRWVKADTKPEHNVGVFVFIPGEDNHITSGMWDISNEWVLLDEYRTPEEEVTHWMPLPAFPEGYTCNEIPGDWVDAIKKIAKEELSKRTTPAESEEDAVAFHDWVEKYRHEYDFRGQRTHTTAELYNIFKKEGK